MDRTPPIAPEPVAGRAEGLRPDPRARAAVSPASATPHRPASGRPPASTQLVLPAADRPARRRDLVALLAKLKTVLLILGQVKLLATAGTMLVSVVAYALDLGVPVRARVRGPAARPRDGPRDRAPPRGDQGLRADVHPVPGRGDHPAVARRGRPRRGAGRAGGPDPRQPRRRGVPAHVADHRTRLLAGAGLHRLLPEPVQPAAGRAARRRPGDGRDGAVDVVRRLRRDDRAGRRCSPTR